MWNLPYYIPAGLTVLVDIHLELFWRCICVGNFSGEVIPQHFFGHQSPRRPFEIY